MKDQRRLGRGLSSLIPTGLTAPVDAVVRSDPLAAEYRPGSDAPSVPGGAVLRQLPLDQITPNPFQPRRSFQTASLESLAESLKERGAIQPIVVRPNGSGFQLIAGERRWRAAHRAGLKVIPAIIRPTTDEESLELALIENLHREDLNPVDRARGYLAIQTRFKISIDDIATRTGEDRTTVTNYLRMLDLPDDVLDLLAAGRLSMGHGRALLGIADAAVRSTLAAQMAAEGWSVRQAETRVRDWSMQRRAAEPREARPAVADLERRLTETVGTRVRIMEGRKKNTGRLVIEYYSLDDFERITERLGVEPEV